MNELLENALRGIVEERLSQGREGLDYLVSLIVLDEDQARNYILWRQYTTCMDELKNEEAFCTDALTLSHVEFNRRYKFVDWLAAVEYALVTLATTRERSEALYLLKVRRLFEIPRQYRTEKERIEMRKNSIRVYQTDREHDEFMSWEEEQEYIRKIEEDTK